MKGGNEWMCKNGLIVVVLGVPIPPMYPPTSSEPSAHFLRIQFMKITVNWSIRNSVTDPKECNPLNPHIF